MLIKRLFAVLFFLLLPVTAVYAQSDDPGPAPDPFATPFPYPGPITEPPAPWQFDGLRIAFQHVDVTIENQVATTHIEQLFVNDNDWVLEGTYLFPLPEGAAVSELIMWVNDQPIEAKILEKGEARAIYDEIVRQLRDPALLEYVDRNVIQASVFPIPPREERRIEIEYSYLLEADNGLLHYTFPQATSLYTNVPLEEQSIRVAVKSNEAIRAIYSPTHAVDVFRDGEFRAVAGYEAQNVVPEGDFELYYTVSPDEIGLNVLSYREAGQDGFFALIVAPNVEVDEVIAKDVFLVIDTSGSMEGEKIAQARDAALYVVEHLNPDDRFNVVTFSTGTRRFAEALRPQASPGDYASFINSLEAVGGTNISTALLETAGMVDATRPTTILFLTDGLATEGITEPAALLTAVGDAMPENARLFAFGVGYDVDPDLLDSLAQNHRGTTTYVQPGEAIDEEVSAFYAKVSTPVLSDIALEIEGAQVDQIYPQQLPDLFAGTQLVVTGRYRAGGPITVQLTGEVNGRSQEFTYTGQALRDAGGEAFIPRLWATRAIGHLLREIRLHGENEELVQSVINLSTRYGIITPYTSYLIEEDDIFAQSGALPAMQATASADRIVTETEVVEGEAIPLSPVDEAAMAADMAEAEVAAAPLGGRGMPSGSQSLATVGSKTFVMTGGVWVDTAVPQGANPDEQLTFASDAYFDLLADQPELGAYFALGTQVVVEHEGVVYAVTEDGTAVEPAVDLPVVGQPSPQTDAGAPREPDAPPVEAEAQSPGLCGALLAYPILLGFGGVVMLAGRRKRR